MKVQIRDFKAHLSRYLAQVRTGGEPIELTSHRTVVARVVGVPANLPAGLAGLVSSGAAQWQGGKPAGADIELIGSGERTIAELVIQDRG